MPLYQTLCSVCHTREAIWRKVDERDQIPPCEICGSVEVKRIIVAPAVRAEITPYISPATGKVINSRMQRRYDLESSGSLENEPGLGKDIARWKTEQQARDFAPIEKAVDEIVTNLVNIGKVEA